jgi:hypothetical protein
MSFAQFLEEVFLRDGEGLLDTALEFSLAMGEDYDAKSTELDFLEAAKLAYEMYRLGISLQNMKQVKTDLGVEELSVSNNDLKVTIH